MIAQYGENPIANLYRRQDLPQGSDEGVGAGKKFIDKISGNNHGIRAHPGKTRGDGILKTRKRIEMRIAEMNDSVSVQSNRQAGETDLTMNQANILGPGHEMGVQTRKGIWETRKIE